MFYFIILFLRMKLPKEKLVPIQCPLYGFNGDVVMPIGVITLLVTLGTPPKHLNLLLEFLVVKVLLA